MKHLFELFNQLTNLTQNQSWQQNNSQLPNQNVDIHSIDDYIKKTVQQAFQPAYGAQEPLEEERNTIEMDAQSFPYELIELHQYFIVKITLPSHVTLDNIRITLGNCRLHIEETELGVNQVIPLPEQPSKRHMTAQYKDGIVEVRLLKKAKGQDPEIYINY